MLENVKYKLEKNIYIYIIFFVLHYIKNKIKFSLSNKYEYDKCKTILINCDFIVILSISVNHN